MHLILTGATGHVGSGVLDAMLKSREVSKISILSRKPLQAADETNDPRINVIIHEDFLNYDDALLDELKGADGVVWALGATLTTAGQKEYIRVTKECTLAAARAFRRIPQDRRKPFRFIYVAGEDTTNQPVTLRTFAARVYAETILTLAEMRRASPMFHASTVRPGLLGQPQHGTTQGHLALLGADAPATDKLMLPSIRASISRGWRPPEPLGGFLVAMVVGRLDGALLGLGVKKIGAFPIVENTDIRQLMGVRG